MPIQLNVLPGLLPPPRQFDFHLSIWQDAGAIARNYRVDLWSGRHWELIQAYARNLAAHGQKTITATVVEDPWASQTGYPHPSMVLWRYPGEWDEKESKKFKFDYTVFDSTSKSFSKRVLKSSIVFRLPTGGPLPTLMRRRRKPATVSTS